jgi:hypothetical protein
MKTTITVDSETRKELNKIKYEFNAKTVDETINRILKIVKEIKNDNNKNL